METIRIDPKTSKHFWFNYSFVHCVQGSMYSIEHFKIKVAFSKFSILHKIARRCGLLFSILDHVCSGHWDETFWEQTWWFGVTVTASSGLRLQLWECVGGMMGARGRVVRDV